MSFDTFLADPAAVRDRGDWLWILTVPGPSGDVELRFSRRGTATGPAAVTIGSETIAAHTPFRKRVRVSPSMTQAIWKSRTIFGRSLPASGVLELENADGGLDAFRPAAGYRWNSGTAIGYFCDQDDVQGSIGKIFEGRIGKPEFGVGVPVKVPLLGLDADFEMKTSERVYRGTAYGLELFGDKTVSFGTPAAVNVTGDLTIEGWLWLDALPSAAVGYWGWIGGTIRPWAMVVDSTGKLRLDAHVATVLQQRLSTAALSIQKPYHFAFIVNAGAVTFVLWDEDAQTETIETLTSFTSATRDSNVGNTLVLRSGSNATFRPWSDEFRVSNVARTLSQIRADRHRSIPAGSVPASMVHLLHFDDGAGGTVTDSSATAANGTIAGAGAHAWLWMAEGAAELAGTPKPDVFGETLVAPVLVDPIRYIYSVAGGGSVQSIVTDEGGVGHIMDAASSTMRIFLNTTPAAGHCLPYLARGLFRLGSSPTLPICALVQGYNGGAGYANAAGTISRKVVTERGPKLADPGDLDTASFTAYATASSAKMGRFLAQPEPIGQMLDRLNAGAAGWYGFVRASTLFHVERFAGPAVTADYDFDTRHIIDITPASSGPVVYEVIVRFAYNPVVLSEDQAAAAFRGTLGWQARKQEWQEERRTDDDLRDDYPGAAGQSVAIDTDLQDRADAGALADYLLDLLKGEKEGWIVRLRATGLQLKVGQTLTLTYTLQDGTQRAGLDGTKNFVILSTEDLRQREEVKVEVWG